MKLRVLSTLAAVLVGCGGPKTTAPVDAGQPCEGSECDAGFDAGPIADAGVDAGVDLDAGPSCIPGGDGGYINAPFPSLASYCLVSLRDGGVSFDPSVVPYDLNTPLFSDYAVKVRGVWMPPGTQATYDDTNAFAFPPGAILTKSFGFRDDFRKANPDIRWVETRLLINSADAGWHAYTYVWNDGGSDAELTYSGQVTPVSWIDGDGGAVDTNYLVPSVTQCKQCHQDLATEIPIGPKARNLNRSFNYASGAENQLTHWSRLGILTGAPTDPTSAPKLAVWNDPSTGSIEARARAYLEVNCAHCHNADGYARTTGLFLWESESDPTTYGICKPPVAAGPATGGFQYDINPGSPDTSIMIHRMASTTPAIMMPLIGRSVEDVDGVGVVSDWISSLDGGCP